MNLASGNLRLFLGLLFAGLLLGVGCSPNGYITASVQSVIGLDVSENPQTQVPHIRFGFIRNQLYYIPTGKVVVQGGPAGSGKASETPELVSEINVEMEFLHTGKIHEKFAVGLFAVNSAPAKGLFNLQDKNVVEAPSTPELLTLKQNILSAVNKNASTQEKAGAWIAKQKNVQPDTVGYGTITDYVMKENDPKKLQELQQALGG